MGHLRTRNKDYEVDLIVQRPDARVLGIEVKLADRVEGTDVKHLHFRGRLRCWRGAAAYSRSSR